MTTTQTGGGNGAAPDGGSGRQTPRIPTRPGKWYARLLDSGDDPEIVNVPANMMVSFRGWRGLLPVNSPSIHWLAPIPGPAVLAALAEYGDALADLDALWNGADFITRNNVTNLAYAAGDALDAAIRAELDGAA